MKNSSKVDISKYFVVGPENTLGRPIGQIIKAVLDAGFTCIQLRSKEASASELIDCAREAADLIVASGRSRQTTLLIDDRLDVVLAARELGIKVDGVHVGQSDIPVSICRKYLGDDAVIGLSAPSGELLNYLKTADTSMIDYFGAGPLRPSVTKPDCGLDENGHVLTRSIEEIARLAKASPIPVVVGGGVGLSDIPALVQTGIGGFFVVSAIAGAPNPEQAARELADAWDKSKTFFS